MGAFLLRLSAMLWPSQKMEQEFMTSGLSIPP